MGRPEKYSEEMLSDTLVYINTYKDIGDTIPSIAGLACHLEVSKKTIYNWAKIEGNGEFLHALNKLSALQERVLLNGGLSSEFNAAITKLVLYNHDYSGKPKDDQGEEATPLNITFEVKEAVSDIQITNAKP